MNHGEKINFLSACAAACVDIYKSHSTIINILSEYFEAQLDLEILMSRLR